MVTLVTFSQWGRFSGQRDFQRYTGRNLSSAIPTLAYRVQLNRLVRYQYATIVAFFLSLVELRVLSHQDVVGLRCW